MKASKLTSGESRHGGSSFDVKPEPLRALIEAYWTSRDLPAGCSVVHERSKDRGAILRVRDDLVGNVIVKVWRARNLRERCKQLAGLSNGRREWRSHQFLYAAGLQLPEPIAYLNWSHEGTRLEAFAAEDLGPTTKVLTSLKVAVRAKDAAEIARIEAAVIAMTRTLVEAGVADTDHQLNNVVMTPEGQFFRLDVECARRWRVCKVSEQSLGAMIGGLVVSHAYASQPDLARSESFALRLADAVAVSPSVLRYANLEIRQRLASQRAFNGIDSRLSLAW